MKYMKSTIRVDFTGPETTSKNGFDPILRVKLEDTDDVRDSLLKAFFQSLGGQSSWLRVNFHDSNNDITITPVKWHELHEEFEIFKKRVEKQENRKAF